MSWIDLIGYLASVLVFATFCMRAMIPLRLAAILSNAAFIAYGLLDHLYPVLILHVVLLPMNIWRTIEMVQMVRRVRTASRGEVLYEALRPFMHVARLEAGRILFRCGDEADRLYMLVHGELLVEELGETLRRGDIFGEIALFSEQHTRTQSISCVTDVEVLWISERDLAQICYQNPAIAFHLLRLVTRRLIANAKLTEPRNVPLAAGPASAVP